MIATLATVHGPLQRRHADFADTAADYAAARVRLDVALQLCAEEMLADAPYYALNHAWRAVAAKRRISELITSHPPVGMG